MGESVPPRSAWTVVDEGWGRRAADFSTLSEPYNCREYVVVHHKLGVDEGDRLLDVACGRGLALELAHLRGAVGAGIDASQRLVAVARDRNPSADIRVGDMHALPWDDATFDVVTSFHGVWGDGRRGGRDPAGACSGGRVGLTVWGHLKASSGFWVLAPFSLAAAPKVENQAAMVALGRPGAGEELLTRYGFVDIERIDVPFVAEFADPEIFARALASTGPGYEAVQNVGEAAFADAAMNEAIAHLRDGLPLRDEIAVVGYLARTPQAR
jgi:SAM-dependent methyltransferase